MILSLISWLINLLWTYSLSSGFQLSQWSIAFRGRLFRHVVGVPSESRLVYHGRNSFWPRTSKAATRFVRDERRSVKSRRQRSLYQWRCFNRRSLLSRFTFPTLSEIGRCPQRIIDADCSRHFCLRTNSHCSIGPFSISIYTPPGRRPHRHAKASWKWHFTNYW